VFAYLRPGGRQFAPVSELLGRMRWHVRAYAGGLKPPPAGAARIDWSDRPLPTGALRDCDAVLCPGGHGLTCAALLAGKPVLVLPEFAEQMLTARNVEALGAGLCVHPAADARALRRALNRLADDAGMRARALEFATRHAAQRRSATVRLAEFAERVHGLVLQGPRT
jgi:UDP:flavonoid glycosyltransferase YjiC (YdhE family)